MYYIMQHNINIPVLFVSHILYYSTLIIFLSFPMFLYYLEIHLMAASMSIKFLSLTLQSHFLL